MPESPAQDTVSLDALRRDIDAADAEMHRLLIHRGQVIERLIAAKRLGGSGGANGGAAFRPDREADMMRRLAARHSGRLPLSTVEHIWREIIGTFTQLQAPYRVFSARAGEPAMRDLLRYYFGFASPLVAAASNAEAVAAVAASGTDLAVVALNDPLEERWWRSLTPPDGASGDAPEGAPKGAPKGAKVIAALPFLPLSAGLDFPAALVVGPADVEAPAELFLYAVELDRAVPPGGPPDVPAAMLRRDGRLALLASPHAPVAFAEAAPAAGDTVWLGGFAAPAGWPDRNDTHD